MDQPQEQLTKRQRRDLRKQEKVSARNREISQKKILRLGIWFFVALVLGGIIFLFIRFGSDSSGQPTLPLNAVSDTDQYKGNKEAKVVIIEYSDFQCPACASYSSMVKELTEEFTEEIAFVYRHFPLKQTHSNAEAAAWAAEAAGRQDKFWEMHYKIFDNQNSWSNLGDPEEKFLAFAEELELDIDKFKLDQKMKEIKDKVANDRKSGTVARVNSTPTFFLNGEKISTPKDYSAFKRVVEEAIL